MKTILDLCSGSGSWSEPYAKSGYAVVCVDVAGGDDVRLLEYGEGRVHGILAAPPCTHLCSSGAKWWQEKGPEALTASLAIADACLRAVVLYRPDWWALENPIGRLSKYYGKPTLTFDPWEYGDPWTKRTCVWGRFTAPERCPCKPVTVSKIHTMSPSDSRSAERSITPAGFAASFFRANP